MEKKIMIAVMLIVAVGLFGAGRAWAGSLDAPAGPTSPASAMYTLEDIYNCMDTRTNVSKRTGAFREPTAGPTTGTMHTLNDIMDLVVRRVGAASKTGQTNSYAVGDDGALQIGLAWPNPRFSPVAASGAETNQIRDNLTGLIWARNANLAKSTTWSTAGTCIWATAFNVITNRAGPVNGTNNIGQNGYGGTNDWRLPNVRELHSLIDYRFNTPALSDGTGTNQWTEALGPFTGVLSGYYWSSTTYPGDMNNAYYVGVHRGYVSYDVKTNPGQSIYVWPVRGGQ